MEDDSIGDGADGTAGVLEMELTVSLVEPIGSCRVRYQVWEDGRQIERISSGEWWVGDTQTAEDNRMQYDKRPPYKRLRFND